MIRILILILIRIIIMIKFHHLNNYYLHSPFLVSNHGGGGHQHPQPVTSYVRRFYFSRLPIPPCSPLCHLLGTIVFIINLPLIGVKQRVGGGI